MPPSPKSKAKHPSSCIVIAEGYNEDKEATIVHIEYYSEGRIKEVKEKTFYISDHGEPPGDWINEQVSELTSRIWEK